MVKKIRNLDEAEKLIEHYEYLISSLPGHVYWKDKEGKFLGCNDLQAKDVGFSSKEEMIGKTDYDFSTKITADDARKVDLEVMNTKTTRSVEELVHQNDGSDIIFLSKKVPIIDKLGNSVGILGISFDITQRKNKEKEIEIALDNIIANLPGHVYWKDKNFIYRGCNEIQSLDAGFSSRSEMIGKTDYEMPWKIDADALRKSDQEVINTGKIQTVEEPSVLASGKKAIFLSKKIPLKDENNNIVGVLGISLDITERKRLEEQAAELKVENALQKKALETQKAFNKVATQVAHDIRSPLISLKMVTDSCAELPEAQRIVIRNAITGITDIANSLLRRFKTETTQPDSDIAEDAVVNTNEPLLVSTLLMQLLTDKKYEYPEMQWELEIAPNAHFVFIAISSSDLKRSLSNIINNAVDACTSSSGRIVIRLALEGDQVRLRIEDNGKGIQTDILAKINAAVAVTAGKESGHGIGLTQVRETIKTHGGSIAFNSTLGQGTQVTLTFPRITTPAWMADRILLKSNDKVIILDDDTSIHGAWDLRFQSLLEMYPDIELHHFSKGQQALDFIQSQSDEQKAKLFLLTDFELLKQDLDGLMVVEKSGLSRTLLVTSHYRNTAVRERAMKTNCKILPKEMASEIDLDAQEVAVDTTKKTDAQSKASVDLVIVDDDVTLVNNIMMFVFVDHEVDTFESPEALLAVPDCYRHDTPFLLDNQFKNSKHSGIDLAKILHEQGYTQLYLFSGETFGPGELPDYLNVIRKDDLERLKQLL